MKLGQQDPWLGQQLGQSGRYHLEELLGQGGMGRVYKAVDRKLSMGGVSSYRAVKLLNVDLASTPDGRERFRREMQACILLQNPHIIRFFDYGVVLSQCGPDQVVEVPFTVMEWIPGVTLDQVLKQVGFLPISKVLAMGCQLTSGLQAIHRGISVQGKTVRFVHRDLKPENIFILQTEDGDSLKIGDFGFVKFVSDMQMVDLTQTGQYGGTPDYSSPEQLLGSKLIDSRSDIYSLGCILYEMLSGQNPFGLEARASMPQWLEAHLKQPPQPFAPDLNIPKTLEVAILRCLEKDPLSRFSTAGDLEAALQRIQAGLDPGLVQPISLGKQASPAAPRNTYEDALSDILEKYQLKLQVFKQEAWLHLTLIRPMNSTVDSHQLAAVIKKRLEHSKLSDITQLRVGSRVFGSAQLDWVIDYDLTIALEEEEELPVQDEDIDVYSPPTNITTTDLVAEEMTEFLESSLPDNQLRLRLKQKTDTLYVLVSYPPDHTFDFNAITRRLAYQINVIQIPGVNQLAFYGRAYGAPKPTQHRQINLETDVKEWETMNAEAPTTLGASRATVETQFLPPLPSPPQRSTASVQLDPLEHSPQNFPQNFSEYCFVRNRTLLTTQLPPPDPDIAQLIIFFHDFSLRDKHLILPVMNGFFQDPLKVSTTEFSPEIQNWLNAVAGFNERKFKSVAVWLSRYCQDPDQTLNQVQASLNAALQSSAARSASTGSSNLNPTDISQMVIYRSHSHWIVWLIPLVAIVCQVIGLFILIPSPLSMALLGVVGLQRLPYLLQGILALSLMGFTLPLLLRHHQYSIELTQANLRILTTDILFKQTTQVLNLIDVSHHLHITRDPLGQLLNYGTVILQGKQIEAQTLPFVMNPHQLWTQIQYLKQQIMFGSMPDEGSSKPLTAESLPGSSQGRCFGEDRRYCLEVVIGQGGMGRVYRATDRKLSVYVAVKFMLHTAVTSKEAIERFKREMQACLGLQDERIVRVLDYGVTQNELKGMEALPYLVMEYVSAPTLSEVLHRIPRFEVVRAVNIARQLALALHVVHAGAVFNGRRVQFIHRDLKPSNIFLIKESSGAETIKIADFGLVKIQGEISIDSLSETGQFRGTVNYAAPEQCDGRRTIDTRVDIYSLGCLLYEMLSGSNPYGLASGSTPTQWMYAHVYAKPLPFTKSLCIPTQLETIVFRCLAKEPNTRFSTAKEVYEALSTALD